MVTENATDTPALRDPSAPSEGDKDIETQPRSKGEKDKEAEAELDIEKKEKKERRRQLKKSALLKAEIAATLKAREDLLKSPVHRLQKLKAEEAERVREEEEEVRIAESKRLAEAKAAEEARLAKEAKAERIRIETEERTRKEKFAKIKQEQEAIVQARQDQRLKSQPRLDVKMDQSAQISPAVLRTPVNSRSKLKIDQSGKLISPVPPSGKSPLRSPLRSPMGRRLSKKKSSKKSLKSLNLDESSSDEYIEEIIDSDDEFYEELIEDLEGLLEEDGSYEEEIVYEESLNSLETLSEHEFSESQLSGHDSADIRTGVQRNSSASDFQAKVKKAKLSAIEREAQKSAPASFSDSMKSPRSPAKKRLSLLINRMKSRKSIERSSISNENEHVETEASSNPLPPSVVAGDKQSVLESNVSAEGKASNDVVSAESTGSVDDSNGLTKSVSEITHGALNNAKDDDKLSMERDMASRKRDIGDVPTEPQFHHGVPKVSAEEQRQSSDANQARKTAAPDERRLGNIYDIRARLGIEDSGKAGGSSVEATMTRSEILAEMDRLRREMTEFEEELKARSSPSSRDQALSAAAAKNLEADFSEENENALAGTSKRCDPKPQDGIALLYTGSKDMPSNGVSMFNERGIVVAREASQNDKAAKEKEQRNQPKLVGDDNEGVSLASKSSLIKNSSHGKKSVNPMAKSATKKGVRTFQNLPSPPSGEFTIEADGSVVAADGFRIQPRKLKTRTYREIKKKLDPVGKDGFQGVKVPQNTATAVSHKRQNSITNASKEAVPDRKEQAKSESRSTRRGRGLFWFGRKKSPA